MFGGFFKRRKFRTVAFAEVNIKWADSTTSRVIVFFLENDNEKRKYTLKGYGSHVFEQTHYYGPCEIWNRTGLLPEWAKDPLAEKLSR